MGSCPQFHASSVVFALAFLASFASPALAAGVSPCGSLDVARPDGAAERTVFTGIDRNGNAFTLTQNPETGAWTLWAITDFRQEAGGLEVGTPCVVLAGEESKLLAAAAAGEASEAAPDAAPPEQEVVAAPPTETPTATPEDDETYRVTRVASGEVLDLRTGPGTDFSSIVGIPPSGAGIAVGSCKKVSGYRHLWCEATWQGKQGWASACCMESERTGRRLD